jgi:murein DD-endopeptidase MepM/ murein hydrolase activator NlpD
MNSKMCNINNMHSRKWLLIIFLFIHGFTLHAQSASFRYAVMPENPRPGEPVTISVNIGAGAVSAVLTLDGRRLARALFFPVSADSGAANGGGAIGGRLPFVATVLTVPATARTGRAVVAIEGTDGIIAEIPLNIAGREFVSEVIELNAALTSIRADPDPQKDAEANYLWSILNRTAGDTFYFSAFRPPVESTRRTSFFGDRRVFKYSNGNTDVSIHAGIDYGVPTGTVVSACGSGKVVLARDRIVTGKSVVIEHLPGVYSLYYHLDRIEVTEGALVDVGARLGLSGATGLATGPHLHWEIRVFGENTDPDAFIARPIIDKNAILSRMIE